MHPTDWSSLYVPAARAVYPGVGRLQGLPGDPPVALDAAPVGIRAYFGLLANGLSYTLFDEPVHGGTVFIQQGQPALEEDADAPVLTQGARALRLLIAAHVWDTLPGVAIVHEDLLDLGPVLTPWYETLAHCEDGAVLQPRWLVPYWTARQLAEDGLVSAKASHGLELAWLASVDNEAPFPKPHPRSGATR